MKESKLFVYGTLRAPEVLTILLGYVPFQTPALLNDYCCRVIRGQPFPSISPSPGSTVAGTIMDKLRLEDWILLDEYESSSFQKINVQVLTDMQIYDVVTYALVQERELMITDVIWDYEDFRRLQLNSYLKSL